MKNINQNIPALALLVYMAINIYVAVFNWEVFSTILNIELGFGKVAMPPFIFLFIFGLIIILGLWFFQYKRDMKNQIIHIIEEAKIAELQKDVEIEKLKAEKTKHIPNTAPGSNKNPESVPSITGQAEPSKTEPHSDEKI